MAKAKDDQAPQADEQAVEVIEEVQTVEEKRKAEVERILFAIVDDDREPTYDELLVFQTFGWDEKQIAQETRRVSRAMVYRAVAGTAQDREELRQLQEKAAARLAEREETLRAQIEAAQDELRSLEQKANVASKRASEAEAAAQALRELAPSHIRHDHDVRLRYLNKTVRRELFDQQTEVNAIECVLDPKRYADDQAYLEMVQRYDRKFVTHDARGRLMLSAEFEKAKPKLAQQLEEIRVDVAKLQERYDSERAKIENLLDFYAV